MFEYEIFIMIATLHPLNPWPLASFFSENTQALPQSITIKQWFRMAPSPHATSQFFRLAPEVA